MADWYRGLRDSARFLAIGWLTWQLLAPTLAAAAQDPGTPDDGPSEPSKGPMSIRVLVAGRGGAPSQSGAQGSIVIGPASGAAIHIEDVEQIMQPLDLVGDADGAAWANVPYGTYWVFVPWMDVVPGVPGATPLGASLPDGRPAQAWAEVPVQDGPTADVSLTIFIALP